MSPLLLLLQLYNVITGIGKPYVESLYSLSDLSPYGSNWGHTIPKFVFLPYISFVIVLGNHAMDSLYSRSDFPLTPVKGQTGISGNIKSLISGSVPSMTSTGKAGSSLPLVDNLQYRTLTNCMYWFSLSF